MPVKKTFAVLLPLALWPAAPAVAGGEITGFKLKSCGEKNCLSIESPKAFSGLIASSYAFESAAIRITEKTSQKITSLKTRDVYFDSVSNKIFIRRMAEHQNAEAIYDLTSEKLSLYPLAPKS